MNEKRLRELIRENDKLDAQNEIIQEKIINEMVSILSNDLRDTITFLDNAEPIEIEYVCQAYEKISKHFKSIELIDCMKRNAARTNVNCDADIEYAIKALK